MENRINIGTNREVFWDDYLVEKQLTTAQPFLSNPIPVGCDFKFNNGILENKNSYPHLVKEDIGYRMYYISWNPAGGGIWNPYGGKQAQIWLCVIESTDGIHWTRPNVGLFEYQGSTDNNIVMENVSDSMFVFKDPNPDCPPEERYKAVGEDGEWATPEQGLWCYTSPDGYRFKRSHLMSAAGNFDTLNTVHYANGRYVCYIRNLHNIPNGGDQTDGIKELRRRCEVDAQLNEGIRDIRVMYSDDFVNWTIPERIQFDDGLDIPLYTNQVMPYPRAPHILTGFPTRYVERKTWTPNYERLGGSQARKAAMAAGRHPRLSLTVTDCIFMCSRDGKQWHRNNRSYMAPEYENEYNWVYGDGYPSYGFVDTGDENYYFYTVAEGGHFRSLAGTPDVQNLMYRWKIRKDGFAGYEAGEAEQVLVTKPLTFEGSKLYLNFATSAYGHIYVDVLNEDGTEIEGATSFEIFGNNIDAPICLADGRDYSEFVDKPVRLRFRMLDAKLYALRFAC